MKGAVYEVQTTNTNQTEKPYDVCLYCPHIGKTCDGPNFLAMTFPRWIEWCNLRASYLRITHSQIAERSKIAKGTIDGVLSGQRDDIRVSTMAAITHALTGECWGQYPCHDPEGAQADTQNLIKVIDEKNAEIVRLQAEREKMETATTKQNEFFRGELEFRNRHIDRKNRVIFALSVTIGILGAMIVALFLTDAFTDTWGLFR